MLVGGRLFPLIILSSSLLLNVRGEIINTKERRSRHIFPLLGYLQGYKIGQNLALQLPPFVLSSVIIVPSVNQQQSVNIQNGATDESFQENGDTIQTIIPVKLILNSTVQEIEINFNSTENNTSQDEEVTNLNDTLRQINEATDSSTESNIERGELVSTTEHFETTITEELTTLKHNMPTTENYVYPTAVYNYEMINSLQLTTPSTESSKGLPIIDNKWQNFSSNANKTDKKENISSELQESESTKIGLHRFTTERYYPRLNTRYYNPWYNAVVDQFSITKDSYREEGEESPLPPRYDDRWNRFSSLSKVVLPTSGFKPLAGLYYDGFLHKSLRQKSGFLPFDKYYL